MSFTSIEYGAFFVLVCTAYYAVPHRFRWLLLLVASYYFYMSWNVVYGLLILFVTGVNFATALLMHRTEKHAIRKLLLGISLIASLGVLAVFKYSAFILGTLSLQPLFLVLLPVGISFYTFQTLSYTIDVYRREVTPETHFGYFALFVTFFPQLVAGPIERADHMLPQLKDHHTFDEQSFSSGLRLILWGLIKKLVIADQLAIVVDHVYGSSNMPGIAYLIATLFFGYQIYCDFSGYCNIAIGSARVLGIHLSQNFRRPYAALSVQDFWRRWHITLLNWFRDYIYIPLGGSRVSQTRAATNVMTVFFISGLWHGANWTFVVWGLLHGLYIVIGRALKPLTQGLPACIKWLSTFVLVMLAWIPFRADSLQSAADIFLRIIQDWSWTTDWISSIAFDRYDALSVGAAILLVELVHYACRNRSINSITQRMPVWIEWGAYYVLILCVLMFGKHGDHAFIYFQF